MLVSIFADASFDPQTRAGGFGCWMKSQRGGHSAGGPFKSRARNSGIAEMMACLNAVHVAFVKQIAFPGDEILIQTDCQAAILAFEGKRVLQEDERIIADGMATIAQIKQVRIRFRHVKGHTKGDQPRLWVNNHCDALAKQGKSEAKAMHKTKPLPNLIEVPARRVKSPDERSQKRAARKQARMSDQTNRRAFAFGFNAQETHSHVGTSLSPIPLRQEQEPAQQPVAGHDLGVSHAA
jgi:ribonuclease HI